MVHGYAQVSTLISVLKHDISAFLKKPIVIGYLLDGSGVIKIRQAGPGGNSHSGEYLHSLQMVVLCFSLNYPLCTNWCNHELHR